MDAHPMEAETLSRYSLQKEDKVDPMWSVDEDERRIAIARRAAAGARKALANK
jgi:hypothetical protein